MMVIAKMVVMTGGDSDGGGDGADKASVLRCFVNLFVKVGVNDGGDDWRR